jgi:hypothetical protein
MTQPPQQNWEPLPQNWPQMQYGQYPPQNYGYPPRRRSPLPWLLTIGSVLVVGLVVTLVLVLNSGTDTGSPRGVAEGVVDAINGNDYDDLVPLSCPDYQSTMKKMVAEIDEGLTGANRMSFAAELVGVDVSDTSAVVHIRLTITSGPTDVGDSEVVIVRLESHDDEWCIDQFG